MWDIEKQNKTTTKNLMFQIINSFFVNETLFPKHLRTTLLICSLTVQPSYDTTPREAAIDTLSFCTFI